MEKSTNNEISTTKTSAKKNEDIKSFAESTMNELLGWYGYDAPLQEHVKVPRSCRSFSGSNDSEGDSVKYSEGCGWCGKAVDESTSLISASAMFCSELCFSQSRRASFKRNKTCDWCRHARHAVSYVDFQDNATQLQFCSDKCLNQYKMHIFCRETQAHLELHPHLHGRESTNESLITPDLWLKNCTSPNRNRSPDSLSPKSTDAVCQNTQKKPHSVLLTEPLPFITVTPSTKVLATDGKRSRPRPAKRFKKGCPSTVTSLSAASSFNDIPQDLRVRQNPSPVEGPPIKDCDGKQYPVEEKNTSFRVSVDETLDFKKDINDNAEDLSTSHLNVRPPNIRDILGNILPPPTTFVPYPVILPLPIPIPIPIPIPKMFKSSNGKDLIEVKEKITQTDIVNNNNNLVFDVKNEETVENDSSEMIIKNRRMLRKRKQVDKKPKVFLKQKKTVSILP